MNLEKLFQILRDKGVTRVFTKALAPNDNSKNQIYLAGDFSVLGVLPSGTLGKSRSLSEKLGPSRRQILKAKLNLVWLDKEANAFPAPGATLILYPQYPEIRLSGTIRGSGAKIGRWLDVGRDGRTPGRRLFLGVSPDGRIWGYLSPPNAALEKALRSTRPIGTFGALTELEFLSADSLSVLLAELRRIHSLRWIASKRLDRLGNVVPCNGRNCGGYTLEAELGILPNGLAEPDFLGWEIKTFADKGSSAVITVMTPEPDGGIYCDRGPDYFVRRFGYPDQMGRPDRVNFGGVYKFGNKNRRTGLELTIDGYDMKVGKILDVDGGIQLLSGNDCAASWSFGKLIEHWKRKHEKAAYVPNTAKAGPPKRYRYAARVGLGMGAQFENLLGAIARKELYYDPALKIEDAGSAAPRLKRRSQFRIRYMNVCHLYESFQFVNL